jgi:hypothetical protein
MTQPRYQEGMCQAFEVHKSSLSTSSGRLLGLSDRVFQARNGSKPVQFGHVGRNPNRRDKEVARWQF